MGMVLNCENLHNVNHCGVRCTLKPICQFESLKRNEDTQEGIQYVNKDTKVNNNL